MPITKGIVDEVQGIKASLTGSPVKTLFIPASCTAAAMVKGKSLHWSLYLAAASLVLASVLGLHSYLESFFTWFMWATVKWAMSVMRRKLSFLSIPSRKSAAIITVCPLHRGADRVKWEYRPGKEADIAVKDALRQNMTMVTNAVVLTVDQKPIVPVASAEVVDTVVELLGDFI